MSYGRLILGIVIILIGLSFLFDINILRYLIPLVIIYFGLRILMGKGSETGFDTKTQTQEDKIERVLVFSGLNSKYTSSNFKGGSIVAIFAGGELDLSEVTTQEKEIKMDLVAIFGGVKVRVPRNWQINSEGVGILGGFNNNTGREGEAVTTLKVEGVAIFGGVEVVN
jgi:predicted membrane protein